MDLSQQKLTGKEWDSLERPVSKSELRILRLIKEGYQNVNITFNDTQSLINFVKISENMNMYHEYFYTKYFKHQISSLQKKYDLALAGADKKDAKHNKKKNKNKPLKKRDLIRITKVDKKIDKMHDTIIEFILIYHIETFLKNMTRRNNKDKYTNATLAAYKAYYTLSQLMKYKIINVNTHVCTFINDVLTIYKNKMRKKHFIKYAFDIIEKNTDLHKYKDIKLYEHQKQIFTMCKTLEPKLIMYQAPTGTGKTITPVGLVSTIVKENKRRIIFVCAAKHVGLQLAKSCISLDIKIAIAFGCNDASDIRLHYFAAKNYQKNWKTGGIFRVDNSVGDNVEIIISDIQSYLCAMRYMLAFNKPNELIWYWDEPTITLDYHEHKYHEILQNNWQHNEIPNIILSSATLPSRDDISPVIQSFIGKFNSTNVLNITSHDCTKTIPLLDTKGCVILPHLVYDNFTDITKSLKHIKKYQTLLRHFDLHEITTFITHVNKYFAIKDRYNIDNYFEDISEINAIEIKIYYLKLLGSLKNIYTDVFKYFTEKKVPVYDSTIKLTTNDAFTLTDGPTIYMVENVDKIAKYCLKIANIPDKILDVIMQTINTNETIKNEMANIERELTKNTDVSDAADNRKGQKSRVNKTKKAARELPNDRQKEETQLLRTMECLRGNLIKVELDGEFVPNSFEHLRKFDKNEIKNAFTSNIDEHVVEKIMLLDVEPVWKILLLMGIGVFTEHKCRDYVAIMKDLAQNQQLYLIVASTDYIYGTNYQFCHGYIGKDLENMTQEKLIQALGRVGRRNTRCEYSIRLRNNSLINTLFMKSENRVEIINMNKLFGQAQQAR